MVSATLRLPAVPASVPEARRFVLQHLRSWSLEDLTETVVLLTSEVVTNSVLHARTELELTVARQGDGVQVQVRDGSPVTPRQRQHSADATTGRGMHLLDRLASAWEVVPDGQGKTICFTVRAAADPWAAYRDVAWRDADL